MSPRPRSSVVETALPDGADLQAIFRPREGDPPPPPPAALVEETAIRGGFDRPMQRRGARSVPAREDKPRRAATARRSSTAASVPPMQSQPSRTPLGPTPQPSVGRRRGGPTYQFNTRLSPEAVGAITELAQTNGWTLGETIEQAIAALQIRRTPGAQRNSRGRQ